MAKRAYTPEQRSQALELYRTDGPTAVQQRLGIPKATVSNWAKAAGVGTVRNEQVQAAVDAHRLAWEERRTGLAHDMGRVAAKALARAERELAEGSGRDAQAFTTTMAILVDKAQLLTGAATSRHEHIGTIEAEIARLEAELVDA